MSNIKISELTEATTLSSSDYLVLDNGTTTEKYKAENFEGADSTILKQANVVDNLASTSTIYPLSANQGKVLNDTKEDADATILKQANVVDNLTTESSIYPLSAKQGKVLYDLIRKDNAIYGVKRTLTSTSSAWVRTDNAVGLTANATHDGTSVTNDFDNIYPWSDIITVNYDTTNDEVVAKYGDANFKFDGTNGEVLTYIPQFYIKRTQTSTEEQIQISKKYFDGAILIEPFYIGRYTTSSGVHSYSGVQSTVSQNIATFRTQAKTKGSKWSQLDWRYCVIEYLYLVEYADGNSQSKLGLGVSSVSAQINTGGCDSLGMKSGCLANAGATAVIYRGIENPYGNIWQFLDGINIKDYQAYVCYDHSQYVSDTFTSPYTALGYVDASASGNPFVMGYDSDNPLIGICKTTGTAVYGDSYWCDNGNRIVVVGGRWSDGTAVGLFSWSCYAGSGVSGAHFGGRLLKSI